MERRSQQEVYDEISSRQSRDRRGLGFDRDDGRERKRRRYDDRPDDYRPSRDYESGRDRYSEHRSAAREDDRYRPDRSPPRGVPDGRDGGHSYDSGSQRRNSSRFDMGPPDVKNDAGYHEALEKARSIASKLGAATGGAPEQDSRTKRDTDGKIREKIYFPINEHPGVNFIGGLVGPKGATLRSIETESACRVFVRGKGTGRGGDDNAGDENEPTHALMIADDESQIIIATKMINEVIRTKIADGPVPGQRSSGPGQDSSSYGPPRGYSQDGGSGGGGEVQRIIVTVPSRRVGSVIGRGGEVIKQIQETSGAHVHVEKENEMMPGTSERRVYIEGPEQSVNTAREMIGNIVVGRGTGPNQQMPSGHTEKRFKVPHSAAGQIIGRGGETIRELQDRSGCRIVVDKESDFNNTRQVTLMGSQECVAAAEDMIWSKVGYATQQQMIELQQREQQQQQMRMSGYQQQQQVPMQRPQPGPNASYQAPPQHQQQPQYYGGGAAQASASATSGASSLAQARVPQQGIPAGSIAPSTATPTTSATANVEGDAVTQYDWGYYQEYLKQYYAYYQSVGQQQQQQPQSQAAPPAAAPQASTAPTASTASTSTATSTGRVTRE